MKYFAFFILILCFVSSGFGQTKKPKIKQPQIKLEKTYRTIIADVLIAKQSEYISVNYDKFDNLTVVYCNIDLTISISFKFKGASLIRKIDNFTVFTTGSSNKYDFFNNRKLQFIADKQRVGFIGRYGNYLDKNAGVTKEFLAFVLDTKILEMLANAENVEYRAGKYESYLVDSEKNRIKFMLSLATPY
jgi:hypothetical protein